MTSVTTCSASAELSTIIALMPPVSAMKGTIGPGRAASDWAMERAVSVPPVKAMPAMRGSFTRDWPTLPSPGSKASALFGTPACSSSAMARAAISGVCSAGLAATALPAASAAAIWPVKIASGKFHGEMAANTPRPPMCPGVAFASGPAQLARRGKILARLQRIPAAEVSGLAHFGNTVCQCLAGFARQQRQQFIARGLDRIGGAFEHLGAMRATGAVPGTPATRELVQFGIDLGGAGIVDAADNDPPIGGTAKLARTAGWRGAMQCGEERRGCRTIGEIEAGGIGAIRIQRTRQRNTRIAAETKRGKAHGWIGDDGIFRHRGIDQAMHEAGIGAVLQQAAHQIGEQILVRAHRCIDTQRTGDVVV